MYGHISLWDTSLVTDMNQLFMGHNDFNDDISLWDVSKVTTMESMFNQATSFNQPLEGWSVGGVTTMEDMFYYATSFNQPLEGWNVEGVTTMEAMFSGADSLEQVPSWKVESSDRNRSPNDSTNVPVQLPFFKTKHRQCLMWVRAYLAALGRWSCVVLW
jgi:surface protein